MSLGNIILLFLVGCSASYGVVYDYYTAQPASTEQLEYYEAEGVTDTCTVELQPCSDNEPRRVDGSCVSLKRPAKGTFFTPVVRVLPAHYHNGYLPRLAQSGDELPLARTVRLNLLNEGNSPNLMFNHHLVGLAAFTFTDVGSPHDVENMLLKTTYCCEEAHRNDYECTPNLLTPFDPVYQLTGIDCMNSTRPLTFQDYKCTKDAVPAPLKKATNTYDLSQLYNGLNTGDKGIRSYVNGQLTVVKEEGYIYPPTSLDAFCPLNTGNETRCFEYYANSLYPNVLYGIWFVRNHNFIASNLAEINPSWSDEKLYQVAKDINIAYYQQMLLYEWLLALEGRDNLIKAGIINKHDGFRDLYDEDEVPEVTLELTFAYRWFHLMQPMTLKFYDRHGNFVKDYPVFNTTFRTGLLTQGENIEYFTQAMIRAGCRAYDSTISQEMANNPLPAMQRALDVTAGDINKCRNLGLAPYVDYVKHFTGVEIKSFDDLSKLMSASVSISQLKEIRKASIARLMCDVGDGITEVPKKAIYNISPTNPLVSCNQIKTIDFRPWAEETL